MSNKKVNKNSAQSRVSAKSSKPKAPQPPSKTSKPKTKTMYASGVVIDGQTWTERKDGNLMGTCTYNWHDARLWATKPAARRNAERIAARFSRNTKAKPFISAISMEK